MGDESSLGVSLFFSSSLSPFVRFFAPVHGSTRARREIFSHGGISTGEETIRSALSLNYFRALAATRVRYGVMDDALGNPPPFSGRLTHTLCRCRTLA